MENINIKKRAREDLGELEFDSPEVKRLREDLFDNLDDDELCTTNQDLDSFMKSFEEEITASHYQSPTEAAVVDLTSESGESQLDLGYLLEASDDELGIPPSTSEVGKEEGTELVRVSSDSSELSELWGSDELLPNYDSFDVALDGLFDYTEMGFGPTDFEWRPETLPA